MTTIHQLLNQRRKALGMSYQNLAKKSGVSMNTVVRILSGNDPHAAFSNVEAIARELGVSIKLEQTQTVEEIRERQAHKKAVALVAMVQGNSGLESQGLQPMQLQDLTKATVHELLAGPNLRLWND